MVWDNFKLAYNGPVHAGVGEVKAYPQSPDNMFYDLMGRRVSNPTHGVYIRQGKKVLVK